MATYGFRAKRADGSISVDISSRLPRFIGEVANTGTSNGSVSVPALAGKETVYQLSAAVGGGAIGFGMNPIVSISAGGVVSWSFDQPAAYRTPARITYGILG